MNRLARQLLTTSLALWTIQGLTIETIQTEPTDTLPGVSATGKTANACSFQQQQEVTDRIRLDHAVATIKSRADLDEYLMTVPARLSALAVLSSGARQRFAEGLVFNKHGLVSYDHSDIVTELSASEIYRLMSLFGAQRTVPLISGLRIESELDRLAAAKAVCRADESATHHLTISTKHVGNHPA